MEMPESFVGGGYLGATALEFSPAKRFSQQMPGENFAIDDLLDFSNYEAIISDVFFDNIPGNSTDSSTITVVHGCDSPVSGGENDFSGNFGSQFSGEIIVPYDDLAELEWLSNFVEDSFSTDHNIQSLALAVKSESSSSSTFHNSGATAMFVPETPFPAKARSKRSRAAPCDWSTRLVRLPSEKKPPPSKTAPSRRKDGPKTLNSDSYGRKCVHCSTEKTPQWRTGPSGPKTLCNACGVRYKSGRLVPEYRPAASPTFESTKHSNSHRRVLELRGQNQFLNQRAVFDASNGGDDFLINGDMI